MDVPKMYQFDLIAASEQSNLTAFSLAITN